MNYTILKGLCQKIRKMVKIGRSNADLKGYVKNFQNRTIRSIR